MVAYALAAESIECEELSLYLDSINNKESTKCVTTLNEEIESFKKKLILGS